VFKMTALVLFLNAPSTTTRLKKSFFHGAVSHIHKALDFSYEFSGH
jgi:hypothetical protein